MFVLKQTFRDGDGSLKEKKNVVLICVLSHQDLIDLSCYYVMLHMIDPVSRLPSHSLSEEKHSDPCIADSGEVLHTEEKPLIGNVASSRK